MNAVPMCLALYSGIEAPASNEQRCSRDRQAKASQTLCCSKLRLERGVFNARFLTGDSDARKSHIHRNLFFLSSVIEGEGATTNKKKQEIERAQRI